MCRWISEEDHSGQQRGGRAEALRRRTSHRVADRSMALMCVIGVLASFASWALCAVPEFYFGLINKPRARNHEWTAAKSAAGRGGAVRKFLVVWLACLAAVALRWFPAGSAHPAYPRDRLVQVAPSPPHGHRIRIYCRCANIVRNRGRRSITSLSPRNLGRGMRRCARYRQGTLQM